MATTPTGLAAASGQVRRSLVTWNGAVGTDTTGYRLYRDTALVYSGPDPSYDDTGLTDGQSVSYKVSAFDTGGESAQSAAVTALTLRLPTASTLTASAGDRQVSLSWTVSSFRTVYRVYRDDALVYESDSSATTLIDPVALNGVSYTYRVAPANDAGETSSAPQTVTPAFAVVAPAVTALSWGPHLNDTWMDRIQVRTTGVKVGTGGVVPVTLVKSSGVLVNPTAITLPAGSSGTGKIITGVDGVTPLWESDPVTIVGDRIEAFDLVVYLEG